MSCVFEKKIAASILCSTAPAGGPTEETGTENSVPETRVLFLTVSVGSILVSHMFHIEITIQWFSLSWVDDFSLTCANNRVRRGLPCQCPARRSNVARVSYWHAPVYDWQDRASTLRSASGSCSSTSQRWEQKDAKMVVKFRCVAVSVSSGLSSQTSDRRFRDPWSLKPHRDDLPHPLGPIKYLFDSVRCSPSQCRNLTNTICSLQNQTQNSDKFSFSSWEEPVNVHIDMPS